MKQLLAIRLSGALALSALLALLVASLALEIRKDRRKLHLADSVDYDHTLTSFIIMIIIKAG